MVDKEKTTDAVDDIHEKLFTIADNKILQILNLVARADIEARRIATEPLRPRLKHMRPPRPLTAMRLYSEAFEDLLDNENAYERTSKRISRATSMMGWKLLMTTKARELAGHVEKDYKAAGDDLDRQDEVLIGFWKICADELDSAVARSPDQFKTMNTILRRDVYRQMADIGHLLRNGDLVLRLKTELPPRPIDELIDEDIAIVVEILQESARRGSGIMELILRALMARMERPGDLLEVLAHNDIGLPQQEQAILTREVGTQASAHAMQQAESAAKVTRISPNELIEQIAVVAERIASLDVGQLKAVPVVVEQLNQARTTLRETVVRELLEGAAPEISEALTMAGKADQTAEEREESLARAEEHLIALRRAGRYGETLRMREQLDSTMAKVSGQIESQAEDAVNEMVDTPKAERDIDQAKEVLFNSVRMLELAAGSNRADSLRRRGMATLDGLTTLKPKGRSPTADLEDIDEDE